MGPGDAPDQEHTGCMIALRLPIEQAARVSHPGGVPASDYHVTLAYLGKLDDISKDDRQEIAEAVAETAQEFGPLSGSFPSGFGTFTPSPSSDGKTPYWAQPDVPDIHDLRHRLMERLDEHGVAGYVATDHGFNPHVTIGYLDPDEDPPTPPPVSPAPISFRDMHLVFGPDDTRIPLQGGDTPLTSAAAPPVPPRPVRRRVTPIPAGVDRVLQRMVKEHNSRVPTDLRVNTPTVRAVYARGVQGFNLAQHPGMTRDGHAFKRVSEFLASISEHPLDDSRYVSELQDMDLLPRPVVLALRHPSLRDATTPLAQAGAHDLVASLVSASIFPATDPRRRLTLSRITAAVRAGGLSTALALPALQALLADGNSRAARSARARRQLRDRFGKWIEMGGGIRFKVKSPGAPGGGKWYHGTATGIDAPNGLVQVKLNEEDGGQTVSVPANKVEKTKATLPGPGAKAKLPNGLNPGEDDTPDAPALDSPELQEIPDTDVTPGADAPGDPDDADLPPLVLQSIQNLNARIPDDHPLANQRDAFADRMRVAFHDRNENDTDADEYRADTQELIDDLDTFTEDNPNLDDNSREAFQDFAGDVATFRDDPSIVNSGDGKEPKAVLPQATPEPAATEKPTTPSGQSLMGDNPNEPTSEGKINTSGITEQRAGEAVASVLDSLRQAAKDAGKDPATGAELYNWIVGNANENQLLYNGDLVTKNGTDKIPVPNRPDQQDIKDAAQYLKFFGHNNAVHGPGEGSGLKRANNQKTAAKELARLQNTPALNPTHPSNTPATPTPTPAPEAPATPSTPPSYDDTADIAGNLEDLAGAWDEAVNQLPPELRGDARTMRNVIYNASDLLQSGGTTKEEARDALREALTDFEDIAYDMSHEEADTDHLISDLTGGVWDVLDQLDGPKQGAPGDADADAQVTTDMFGDPVPSHWNKTGQDTDENGNAIEHWATDASGDTIDVGYSDGNTMDETGSTILAADPVYVLRDESGAAVGNYKTFDEASDAHDFSHDVVDTALGKPVTPAEQPAPSPSNVKQERLDNNLDNADRPLPTGWTAEELQGEDTDVMARGPQGHVAFTDGDGNIEVAKLNTETGQYEPVGEFDNWGDARDAVTPAVPETPEQPVDVLEEPIQTTVGNPPFNILSEAERGKNGDGYHPSGPYGRYGAAGLMIRAKDENGQDRYLIVQRGQGLSSNKGRWQFPGGALDEHETPQQGAARELAEEVLGGLGVINDLSEVGNNVYTNGTDWAYTTTLADIPSTFAAAPFPGNEWETGDAKWVTASELRKMSQDGKMIPALSNGAVDPLLAKFPAAATPEAPEAPETPTPADVDAPETDEIPDLAAEVYDTSDWVKVGGQGGSNAGGTYRAPDGTLYYVKQPKSPNHAHNEVLASSLYSELGVPSAYVRLGDGGVIVSKIVPDAKSDLKSHLNDPDYLKKLQDGFVVDAWLANWDVAGLVYDNVVSDADGNPVRIDGGGALVFRAMGTPKGHLFGDTVGEIETLRSPSMNPTSSKVFGSMSDQDMRESAKKLLDISESRIDDLVDSTGFDAANKELLKQRLKSRRNDLLERFDLVNSYNAPESMIDDTVKDLDHELNAPEYEPWEQELLGISVPQGPTPDEIPETPASPSPPPAPEPIPNTGPKVRIAADGVTQLEIGDKVISLKDGSTGTVVKHDPSDKYVKVKMDDDGKVKARATKTLMLQDAGGDVPEDMPSAPAPDEELELTPESEDAVSTPTPFSPEFIQDLDVALGKMYGVADDSDPSVTGLLDDITSELKVAKDDYPKGLSTASEAKSAIGGAKNAINTLALLEDQKDPPNEELIDASAELFDLVAALEGAIDDDVAAPTAAPGSPLPFTVGGRNVKVGDTLYYKETNATWVPVEVLGVKEFPDPWGGNMQVSLELKTPSDTYVYAQDDFNLINQSTMTHLTTSPPAGTVLPLSYNGGDQKMTVGDKVSIAGVDGFEVMGLTPNTSASNVQFVNVRLTNKPDANTVPVLANSLKPAPAVPETEMPGPTPTPDATSTPATQLNLGAGYALPPTGATVSHVLPTKNGDRYLVQHPNGSLHVYDKKGSVDKAFSQSLSSYAKSGLWKPYTPTTEQLTPATPGEPATGAQVNGPVGNLSDVYNLPVGTHVYVGDTVYEKLQNGMWKDTTSAKTQSSVWIAAKANQGGGGVIISIGQGGASSTLPSTPSTGTAPEVGDEITVDTDLNALPTGAKVSVGDEEFTKADDGTWTSPGNAQWSDNEIKYNAGFDGGKVTDNGAAPTAPAEPAAPTPPPAPAAPTLAQNPPTYGPKVIGQDGNHLWVGATVVHPVHGKGTVAAIEPNGNYLKVWGADGKKRALSRKKLTLDGVPPHSTTVGGPSDPPSVAPPANQSAVPATPVVSAPYTTPSPVPPGVNPSSLVFPPATNVSGQLVAGQPDPSSPLYQAPEPVPPPHPPAMDQKVVHETWLLAADANYKKRMKANNPNWVEKPLSASSTYNEYLAVVDGSESSLKTLLNKTRITQEMYDDALQQIKAKSKVKNEAAKVWEAQYKEYQAQRAEWLAANGQRGIILKGMSEGALHLTNAGAYAHFWENYKPGQQSPGDPGQSSPPGKFSPKAATGVSSQKSSSHFQAALRALKLASLKISNLGSTAKNLDRAMAETKPLEQDIMMIRTLGSDSFINPKTGLPYTSYGASNASLNDIVGSVQHDWGFAEAAPGSLKSGSTPGYHAGNVTMQFRVPKGTRGVWTGGKPGGGDVGAPYNQVTSHKSERGFILERGLAYYIHKVEKKGGTWHVDAEIIPKDVGYGDFGHFTGPDFDPAGVFYPPGTTPGGVAPVPPGQQAPAPGTPGTPAVPGTPGEPAAPGAPGTAPTVPVSV